MTKCQSRRRKGNEDNVGKTCNDQKKLSGGAAVVVEIADRDNAGPPGHDEQHYESKNHLEEHKTQ